MSATKHLRTLLRNFEDEVERFANELVEIVVTNAEETLPAGGGNQAVSDACKDLLDKVDLHDLVMKVVRRKLHTV